MQAVSVYRIVHLRLLVWTSKKSITKCLKQEDKSWSNSLFPELTLLLLGPATKVLAPTIKKLGLIQASVSGKLALDIGDEGNWA